MDEQQFCLRWNNFQANITSQFEALRDDEDFTDVTIACEGQRLQAHKVVLSACSPYFKDLFKSNPCSHPIIFMRDVEAEHVVALMEFMYAGEVNVAQAQLSAFLKTAESLKIRGLTDNNPSPDNGREIRDHDTLYLNPSKSVPTSPSGKHQSIAPCSSTVTSSQDVGLDVRGSASPPPSKRQCKADPDDVDLHTLRKIEDAISANASYVLSDNQEVEGCKPKLELPDYLSDDDKDETTNYFRSNNNVATLSGGMEIIPKPGHAKESGLEQSLGSDSRKLHSLEPRPCDACGRMYSNLSNLRQHMKLIHYPTFVSCPICAKSFKTDLYLRRHMTTTHEIPNFKLVSNGPSGIKFEGAAAKPKTFVFNVSKSIASGCARVGRVTRGSNVKNTIS